MNRRTNSRAMRVAPWLAAVVAAVIGVCAISESIAQTRPALVRDVDTPALQPFRASLELTLAALNTQALVTAVPAGKRLVIENLSWNSGTATGTQLVFAALRLNQFGATQQIFQINPQHASASTSFLLQDGAQRVKLYFEAGEEVWLSATKNNGGTATINVAVQGYYITP